MANLPEIEYLAVYLVQLIPAPHPSASIRLCSALASHIKTRFVPRHWHPEQPEKGSGYRAISFDHSRKDGYLDPVLCILAQLLSITNRQLARALQGQSSWTIWCDPGCVSVRSQAGGGELRELYGSLPDHLSNLIRVNHSPLQSKTVSTSPPTLSQPSILNCSPSPNKSKAIPILVPSATARPASRAGAIVSQPTPVQGHAMELRNSFREIDMNSGAAFSQQLIDEDLPIRPCSRTSSASSSSDASEQSTFSISSTATSVSPAAAVNRKLAPIAGPTMTLAHVAHRVQEAGFIRHHSTSSLPYLITRSMTPINAMHFQRPGMFRSDSPNFPQNPVPKRRHGASASVSSLGGGRGMLVMKEGPGTVTEHSGGKVGVMGGGVLLGLPKDKDAKLVGVTRKVVNRRGRA
ncbi:hypothetical protein BY996DRAFT_4586303 [Phakopsora pachyrhizi]|uniref:Anti-proliferative protein domain-containing protein n=1 Tax=Phakopsora pachyrhizi TaxID=170000 RepID=A0AAV0B9N0_PHAPC|nr:hypothetical protein BY996DRAFT_4586303 [Phakopsora pachyrhizi]CAH7681687.1 hypothetical protein PPACK8108_LOCUS14327 [Phakopsora pachyrhizi]